MTLKKLMKITLKIIAVILGIVIVYVICGLLLPIIPISAKKTNESKNIEIYILTNGVHTDLVVPIKNEWMDWTTEIPFDHTKSKRTDYQFLSVGWGDKGFYLDTPTWADLKFSTAFNAAFWLGESAMHCTFYNSMKEGEDCKKIMISKSQYLDLVKFIKDKFDRDQNGKIIFIKTNAVYGDNDAFYDAKGKYSFLETCNTWANDGLKAAGQKQPCGQQQIKGFSDTTTIDEVSFFYFIFEFSLFL